MVDFREAIKEIEPSALREIYVEVPTASWDDVGGLDEDKRELKESIEWPLNQPETFEQRIKPLGESSFSGPGNWKDTDRQGYSQRGESKFHLNKGPRNDFQMGRRIRKSCT